MVVVAEAAATVKEIWVYPVKACQGIKVEKAKVTVTGFEYDRNWCIVDLEGTHVPKLEAISGRRMPVLASIMTSFENDHLCLDAPGMEQIKVPLAFEAYAELPTLPVESAGEGWSLGFVRCVQHESASLWINKYLNGESTNHKGLLVNGKTKPGRFAFCRSVGVLDLAKYPPIFPLLQKSKVQPEYKARFEGNSRQLSDFAPFLLVSQSSARALAQYCQIDSYPCTSFRGNIIVDRAPPWAEENWSHVRIGANETTALLLHNIKPCPRCIVPCRDQTNTGEFLFAKEPTKLWNVLKRIFPRKHGDPEWGRWAGVFMGCYMGHHGQEGMVVSVGDDVVPTKTVAWDEHLTKSGASQLLITVSMAVVAIYVSMYTSNALVDCEHLAFVTNQRSNVY